MGSWGSRLYENDTALEVRDMIDDIFDKYTGDDAIEVLLDRIAAEYTDEEDRSVALLVAADRVLKRGTVDISALYSDISNSGASLSQETTDTLIGLMRSREHRKKAPHKAAATRYDMARGRCIHLHCAARLCTAARIF